MNEIKDIKEVTNGDAEQEKELNPKPQKTKRAYIRKTDKSIRLDKGIKRDILVKVAKGNKSLDTIAKEYNTSKQYISQLKYKNKLEYDKIIEQLSESVRIKSIQVSNAALDTINNNPNKLNKSTALALANIAKITQDITHKPQSLVNIDINIGENRQDNLKFILDGSIDAESIDTKHIE